MPKHRASRTMDRAFSARPARLTVGSLPTPLKAAFLSVVLSGGGMVTVGLFLVPASMWQPVRTTVAAQPAAMSTPRIAVATVPSPVPSRDMKVTHHSVSPQQPGTAQPRVVAAQPGNGTVHSAAGTAAGRTVASSHTGSGAPPSCTCSAGSGDGMGPEGATRNPAASTGTVVTAARASTAKAAARRRSRPGGRQQPRTGGAAQAWPARPGWSERPPWGGDSDWSYGAPWRGPAGWTYGTAGPGTVGWPAFWRAGGWPGGGGWPGAAGWPGGGGWPGADRWMDGEG